MYVGWMRHAKMPEDTGDARSLELAKATFWERGK